MNDFEKYAPFKEWDRDPEPATANLFDDLAEHGRFDEDGGELSDQDWADVIAR